MTTSVCCSYVCFQKLRSEWGCVCTWILWCILRVRGLRAAGVLRTYTETAGAEPFPLQGHRLGVAGVDSHTAPFPR